MASLAKQVLSHVQAQQSLLIDLLKELVEAESPSCHPAGASRPETRDTLQTGFPVRPLLNRIDLSAEF